MLTLEKKCISKMGRGWAVVEEKRIFSSPEGLLETKTRQFSIQFPAVGNSKSSLSPSSGGTGLLQRAAVRRARQVGDPAA